MKELETVMDPIAKDSGLQTNINGDMYTLGFDKIVDPKDFFRLELEIAAYFDRKIELLPEDSEHEKSSKAYLKAEPIQEGPVWTQGYRGVILEPAVPESHEKHSEVINALENVIVAAQACIKKYEND
ncbi:hypothetical protein KY338_02025 [Candidatus Woesearchaeota archaeon]|nr:hypothetical protein [Candidatus Woesearchaeota archaeon]MBW3005945.1 hypothetical protein [Candidatus Woesearchaeota archaeon]